MLQLITPPAREPLTLAEARSYLQVTHESEDAEIQGQVIAARRWVESRTWRTLMQSTWELVLDRFPNERVIFLPRPRLISVESITYLDATGASVSLSLSRVEVDTSHEPGRIRIDQGGWPAAGDRLAAVRIRYVAGWATLAQLPQELLQACKVLIHSGFDNRAGYEPRSIQTAERLIAPYRVNVPNSLPYLLGTFGDLEAAGL
jgi:uncharacterized phiE125 gp8 family phage protein